MLFFQVCVECAAHLKVPLRPALSAGVPVGTSRISTPSCPICRSTCGGAIVIPRVGRTTLPYCRIWSTRPLTESMGIAKPTPEEAPLPAQIQQAVAQFGGQRLCRRQVIAQATGFEPACRVCYCSVDAHQSTAAVKQDPARITWQHQPNRSTGISGCSSKIRRGGSPPNMHTRIDSSIRLNDVFDRNAPVPGSLQLAANAAHDSLHDPRLTGLHFAGCILFDRYSTWVNV